MTIDRKFIISAHNPVNKKQYTQENAVLFCAKDAALPEALNAYRKKCIELNANPEHIESIGLLIDRVERYQLNVECKVPDTIGDEIERCIGGIL